MIFIFGTRHLNPRRIGVRNDYCNACQREGLAELVETTDYGHLFFIPLLPLGKHRRWHCSQCGKDPRARYRTSKPARIMGLFLFPIFIILPFFPSKDHSHPEDANVMWTVSAVFAAIWLYLLYSLIKGDKNPAEDQRRAAVMPLVTDRCVYCGGGTLPAPAPHCPGCGVFIYAEPRRAPPPLPPPLPPRGQ
jgi:hypothetical protein